jgi:hypothetical protein
MMSNWGPSHQQPRRSWTSRRRWRLVSLAVCVVLIVIGSVLPARSTDAIFGALIIFMVLAVVVWIVNKFTGLIGHLPLPRRPLDGRSVQADSEAADVLAAVRKTTAASGVGVYLGRTQDQGARHARSQRAVLLLGPPRSGKTSSVIVPAIIAHCGPVVSTSTKPDVAAATGHVRGREGRLWSFDPTGQAGPVAGTEALCWSPVTSSITWDGAMSMARSMTASTGHGTSDRSHWSNRAQALLAPLLHAAAVHGRAMSDVVAWVLSHDLEPAGELLEGRALQRARLLISPRD